MKKEKFKINSKKRIKKLKEIYNDYVREEDKELIRLTKEVDRLNNTINDYEDRFKLIKKIVEDNILEELDDFSYCCMMSTIGSVCDGKPGFLNILQGSDKE